MKGEQLDPVEDHSLHELVLTRLRDAILEGVRRPGARLKIRDLAAELKVSHMPVREALHVLVVEGLVEREARRGAVVAGLDEESIAAAYVIKGEIEGFAARMAAGRLSPPVLAELASLLEQMEALDPVANWAVWSRLSWTFHTRTFDACANRWALQFLQHLWNYTYRVRRLFPPLPQ